MDKAAEQYVKLALAVGHHDPDYVDAYYGPEEWRGGKRPLGEIKREAMGLRVPGSGLRHEFLAIQMRALITRIEMLEGKRYSFDEESRLLYDAVAPTYPDSHFAPALAELEQLIPGRGPLEEDRKSVV